MGFRDRLLLGLVVLAVAAVGAQLALGYFSFSSSLNRDFRTDLEKYALLVEGALEWGSTVPMLNPAKLPNFSDYVGRFRLTLAGEPILEGGGPFPETDPSWWRYQKKLTNGYALEVALNQNEHHRALGGYLRTGGISLVLSVLLAVLVAWLLRLYLLRPLQELEQAAQSLALTRFPEPLQVHGRDELARLTESFNKMTVKVRQALERERSFTRYASHELRNPLAAMKATTAAAMEGAIPVQRLFEVLDRNFVRLERILEGLLSLARGLDNYTEVEFPQALEGLLSRLPDEERRRVCLTADTATLLLPREALEVAVQNLLDNALKYSSGRVWLDFQMSPGAVISVRDQGPGVPPEKLSRLGEPFYRATLKPDGLGLGLAFVRQVTEHMGGGLELRNHPAGGLEVRLVLSGGVNG